MALAVAVAVGAYGVQSCEVVRVASFVWVAYALSEAGEAEDAWAQ